MTMALRGLALEGKAMSTAVAADGGYLVDPQTADTIRSMLVSTSSMRAIANVVKVDAVVVRRADRPHRGRVGLGDGDGGHDRDGDAG